VPGRRRVKALAATHREAAGQREEPARLWQQAAEEALLDSAYAEALGDATEARRLGRGPASSLVAARALVRLARLDEALAEASAVRSSPDASPEEVASATLIEAEVHGRRGANDRFLALVEEVAAAHPPGLVLLDALLRRARVLWGLGRHEDALHCAGDVQQRIRESPAGAENRELSRLLADSLQIQGLARWKLGEAREAMAAYEESLALARKIGERLAVAATLNCIGALQRDERADVRARASFEESLSIVREIGDRIGIASSLANLGLVYREAGLFDQALAAHREALGIQRMVGDRPTVARSLKAVSDALIDRGDWTAAGGVLEEALRIARAAGDRPSQMLALRNLGQVRAATGDLEHAVADFEQALVLCRAMDNPYNETFLLLRLAEIRAAGGSREEAEKLLAEAVRISEARRIAEHAVAGRLLRARLHLPGAPRDAVGDAERALEAAKKSGNAGSEAQALAVLARIDAVEGRTAAAGERLAQARRLSPSCHALIDSLRLAEDEALALLSGGDRDAAARAAREGERRARERGALPAAERFASILRDASSSGA